jgi:hypothetical protein
VTKLFFKPDAGIAAVATADATERTSAAPQAAKRRVLPIHPALFAAFPLLALYVQNIGRIPIGQIYRPLGLALLGTLAVWALSLLLTRHTRKAAIAASAVVLVFFTYGHLLNLLPPPLRGLAAPGCVAGLAVLLFALLKTRRPLLDATAVLNLASVVLVAPSFWAIGASLWSASQSGRDLTEHSASASQPAGYRAATALRPTLLSSTASTNLPDVYYIILDAYGRADRLKTFYGYDNTPFLRALEKRGFYIARHSGANYNHTPLCLASALSMNYLGDLAHRLGPEERSMEPLRQRLDDNAVAACLRKFGFHYVNIWSGLEDTRVSTADLVLNGEPDISTFEGQVLGFSAFDAAPGMQHRRYNQHRKRLLGGLSNLDTVARLPYPKFVFAHILAPHPPFVFGAHGEAIDPKGPLTFADGSWLLQQITRDQYRSGYIGQLEYVNRRVLEAVDTILRQSRRPPIIILQGDHGSRMNLDWDSQARTDLREPFSILNAYYVPARVRRDLYDTISPVNSFRIVLRDVFGADYRLLPDRSFYSTADRPYDVAEVTDRVASSGSK